MSAITRIAKLTNASLLQSDVFDAVHAALCEGALIAKGDQKTRDGEIICRREVPKDAWREMSVDDFRHQCAGRRFIFELLGAGRLSPARFYYTGLTLSTTEIDRWLSITTLQNSTTAEEQIATEELRPHQAQTPRTGTAGRPTSKDLCVEEMRRWHIEGKLPETLAATCHALLDWLKEKHPNQPRPKAKSLENSIREDYRRVRAIKRTT